MASHLKRQAGVTDATYKKGTIEVRSEAGRGFDIAAIVRAVTGEMGVNPVKRIEATLRGNVMTMGNGKVLHVPGLGEPVLLRDASTVPDGNQSLTGLIDVSSDGKITFKPTSSR